MKAKTKSQKRPHARRVTPASPVRDGMNTMRAELKRAAMQLGFDTSKRNWLELAKEESDSYPFTLDDEEECSRFWPKRVRARVRCLELIGGFTELLAELESSIQYCDDWFAELRSELALGPAPIPCGTYLKQLDEDAA